MPPTQAEKGYALINHAPFTFRWAESTPLPEGYSHGFSFGVDASQASMTIYTYWDEFTDFNDVVPSILGYARKEAGITDMMNRVLPVAHPLAPWLYATTISSVHGVKFVGRKVTVNGVTAKYQRAALTINFTTLPYNVVSDIDLVSRYSSDESKRFVTKIPTPAAEYISIERNFFQFAEGPANAPNGRQFPLGTGRVTVKTDLSWTWYGVPDRYIFDSAGVSTNINACLGTVNNAEIWGYPAGTLLCMPPRFTPVMMPVSPTILGLPPGNPPRAWNVELHFKYWDPPQGGLSRGHNLAMFFEDGLFYLIKATKQIGTGATLFASSDFSNIFKAVA